MIKEHIRYMRKLNRIQELRWKQNLTLAQISRKSGVSMSALDRIENGFSAPNQIQMINISKAFHLSVGDVFTLQ